MKDSFLLHLAYEESLKELSDEDAGKLLKALFEHENPEEDEPEYLTGAVKMAYIFIRTQLDRERTAYEDKCRKLSENASKRGQKQTNASKSKQMQTNEGDKDKEKVKVEDNVEVNVEEEDKDNTDCIKPSLSSLPEDQERESLKNTFNAFWDLYPKKSGKTSAFRIWQTIRPDKDLFEKIMSALNKAVVSDEWIREDGRYVPRPARWLSEHRWEDVLEVSNGPPGRKHHQGRDYKNSDYRAIEDALLSRP